MSKFNLLKSKLTSWSIPISDTQLDQFETYYNLLIDWNSKMNLTAITARSEVEIKHFLDSVALASVINLNETESISDIGTGAGFPGIPIKILFPHIKILLLDSLNKRIGFINRVIDELNLTDITAIHGRAETLAHDTKYREQFDICLSRAVANLSSLTELCLPFVRVGGQFISYKSGDCEEEVSAANKAITLLGGRLSNVVEFNLEDSRRSFVIVDKYENSVDKYPRREGIPVKKPL